MRKRVYWRRESAGSTYIHLVEDKKGNLGISNHRGNLKNCLCSETGGKNTATLRLDLGKGSTKTVMR